MASTFSGSLRFFRLWGVQVYVHWSWFVVAYLAISMRSRAYSSMVWNVAEYLGLFLIVLLHEFGHVLACRQVGGVANEIVLWPLGGVAMGRPPPRPGAELWTIVAGPLVNVVLWPVLMLAVWGFVGSGMGDRMPDLGRLLVMLLLINKWLLIFNLLPIYPLDGGQILRSLLWFQLGRARSLQVAATIGLIGIALGVAYRLMQNPNDLIWTAVLAYFLGSQCFAAFQQARALVALDRFPRRREFRCASCKMSPPASPIWSCEKCGQAFDAFLARAVCPHCQNALPAILCVDCGARHPLEQWETNVRPQAGFTKPYIDV
jgi:Zn-dependent protease